jgi:triphosphatase
MAIGWETELKFSIVEGDLRKTKAIVSSTSGASPPLHQHLEAIYFDTQDHDLWKHGFTLRVRAARQRYIQTVKQIISSGIERREWEDEISGPWPETGYLKNTPLAPLLAERRIRGNLRPAFKVDVRRSSITLDIGAAQVEASFDHGFIEADQQKLAVCELELELKGGDRFGLYGLARGFISQAPLHPSLISKAERGYLLAAGAWGHAAKVSKPHLGKNMTSQQAFQQICHVCLHDFQLNESGLEKLDEVEAVHQGRIAIRRLRAAMTLFRPMVSDVEYGALRTELKWLAGLLGAARDLDVLAASLPLLALQSQGTTQASELAAHLELKRRDAHHALREALDSERGRILLFDLAVWIDDGKWRTQGSATEDEPMTEFVSARLKRHRAKLVEQGADLVHLRPEERHQVRIEAKKLRYMAEFFVDVPGVAKEHKQFKQLVDCCESLQEALGEIRDEEQREAFLEAERSLLADSANSAAETTSLLATDGSDSKSRLKKRLQKAVRSHKKLVTIKPF